MPPEVAFADLQFIIEFVYRGEIDVSEAELQVSKLTNINAHVMTTNNGFPYLRYI